MRGCRFWQTPSLSPLTKLFFGPLIEQVVRSFSVMFSPELQRFVVFNRDLRHQKAPAHREYDVNPDAFVSVEGVEEWLAAFQTLRLTRQDPRLNRGIDIVSACTCPGIFCRSDCSMRSVQEDFLPDLDTPCVIPDIEEHRLTLPDCAYCMMGGCDEHTEMTFSNRPVLQPQLDVVPSGDHQTSPQDLFPAALCHSACTVHHQHMYFGAPGLTPAERRAFGVPRDPPLFPPTYQPRVVEPASSSATGDRDPLRLAAPFVLSITMYDKPRVWDVGSGDGERARVLERELPGTEVVAYDPSPFSASEYSGLAIRDIKSKFDVILLSQVLHHLVCSDPVLWVKSLVAHLAPKGVVVVREDIWNGESSHWRSLDSAHSKYHDNLGPVCFVTRSYLLRIFAQAGLIMVPAVPPDNFPMLRARGYRGQVYHFCVDTTKSMSDYYSMQKRLSANYSRLRDTMLNSALRPEHYKPLYEEGCNPAPFQIPYIRYLRDHASDAVTHFEEVRKYGMTRFMDQAEDVPPNADPNCPSVQDFTDKFFLLAMATINTRNRRSVSLEDVLKHVSCRDDSPTQPLAREHAKLAAQRLEDRKIIVRRGIYYEPGPNYMAAVNSRARYRPIVINTTEP